MAVSASQTLLGHWLPTERIKLAVAYDIALAHEILRLHTFRLLFGAMDPGTGFLEPSRLKDAHAETKPLLKRTRETIRDSLRWGIEQSVMVGLARGMDAHDRWFRAPIAESYTALRRQLVVQGWQIYGPTSVGERAGRLSQWLWREHAVRRCIMKKMLLEQHEGTSAWQAAKALESMFGTPIEGPRWLSTRLQRLTPKDRLQSQRGLVTSQLAAAEAAQGKFRGLSYRTLRIARTEISRTHHAVNKELYAIQPWVTGVRWRLSPGHPQIDICDELAAKGVYSKYDVPHLPHPHCMCFLTPETMPRDQWDQKVAGHATGKNQFLSNYQDFVGYSPIRAPAIPEKQRGPFRDALQRWMGDKPPQSPQTRQLAQEYRELRWWDRKMGGLRRAFGRGRQPEIDRAVKAQKGDAWLRRQPLLAHAAIDPSVLNIRNNMDECKNLTAGAPPPKPLPPLSTRVAGPRRKGATPSAARVRKRIRRLQQVSQRQREQIRAQIGQDEATWRALFSENQGEYDDDVFAARKQRMKKLRQRIEASTARLAAVRQKAHDKINASIRHHSERGVQIEIYDTEMPDREKKILRHYITELQQLVPDRGETYRVGWGWESNISREFFVNFSDEPRRGVLYVSDNSTPATWIHELGHLIDENPRIMQKSVNHLYSRTQSEKARSLKDITGQNYKSKETARPDEFFHAYVGKDYSGQKGWVPNPYAETAAQNPRIDGTEIVSMGLEEMYSNPVRLAEEDPRLFDFIWNEIMHGD